MKIRRRHSQEDINQRKQNKSNDDNLKIAQNLVQRKSSLAFKRLMPLQTRHCFNVNNFAFVYFFLKVGHSRPLFIYFRLFNTVDNKQMFNKILPMSGVEPRTSGIESDRSTN